MIDVNVRITGNDIGIKSFVDYVRTLPFATVEEGVRPKKMTFKEASVNSISAETPYSKNFVDMVLQAEDGIKKGKGKKLSSEEFDNLWK